MLELYSNIKKLRLEKGWTQEDLAKKLGYKDRSMIAKIENGNVDLQQSKIGEIAQAFGVSPSSLLGWEDVPVIDNDSSLLRDIGAEISLDETSQWIINSYLGLTPEQRAEANKYIKIVLKSVLEIDE